VDICRFGFSDVPGVAAYDGYGLGKQVGGHMALVSG
jgi:hypothetical protein